MIELRRPPESAAADGIAAQLRDLVVAFREVEDPDLDAPQITDGGVVHRAPDAISAYLEQLRRDVASWNAFQSDSCYIGDDGRVC